MFLSSIRKSKRARFLANLTREGNPGSMDDNLSIEEKKEISTWIPVEKKVIGSLFLLIMLIQGCKEQASNNSDIEVVELLKTNNKCIYIYIK